MKRVAILRQPAFVIGMLFTINLSAQETYFDVLLNYMPTNFHYGDLNSDLKDYKDKTYGLQAGASFQAGITKHFSLVPEFYFIMKGGALKHGNPLTDNRTITRLYALEMPVLARVHFCNMYLNAGPSVAYNLAGKLKTHDPEFGIIKTDLSFDGSEGSFKRWDAGLQLGGGIEFDLKRSRIAVDARYHYGLVNVHNGVETRNRYLVVNILMSRAWKNNPLAKK